MTRKNEFQLIDNLSFASSMNKKALLISPLAMFPIALAFFIGRSLIGGDMRELIATPFMALYLTVIGYPVALIVGGLFFVCYAKMRNKIPFVAVIGLTILAEIVFWTVVSPLWEREFSNAFCAALIGGAGLGCSVLYLFLARRP